MSFIAEYLIALVGLGVGIDYSLLVVTRWREQRGRGQDPVAAVHAAMASAGRSVLLSGLVVSAGLLALLALPVPFLHGLAYAGLLIPLVSAAAALTLLPILLATAGQRLDWPRRHITPSPSRRWSGWARGVVRWRWAAAAVGLAALAGLILPLFSVHIGLPRATSLAASGPARAGLDTLLAGDVPPGVLTPIEVLSTGDTDVLASRLSRLPGIYAAVAPSSPDYQADGTALITVLPAAEAGQPAGQRTVAAVRSATAHDAAVAGVGGVGVEIIDFTAATYGNLWKMLALIALVTFGLLAVAFRSLLLAAKAIALNFAAVAAATGVLVFVWQDGHGSDALWQVNRHRRHHLLGAGVLVRLPVRALDGLRGIHPVPDPRGIPGHRFHAWRGSRRPRPHRPTRQQRRADPGPGLPGHVQHPGHRHQDTRHRPGRRHPHRRHHHPLPAPPRARRAVRPVELVAAHPPDAVAEDCRPWRRRRKTPA